MARIGLSQILSLSAVVLVAGCAGNASSSQPTASGNLNFGGASTVSTTSTSNTTVPSSGGTSVSTSDSGTGNTAIVPSGAVAPNTTIPSGTQFAVIPAGVGFTGTFDSGLMIGVNGTTNSGVGVSHSGSTATNIALPLTNGANGTSYALTFPGGTLSTALKASVGLTKVTPDVLTIQATSFTGKFYVLIQNGKPVIVSPVPAAITGRIPNNGQNAVGSVVTAAFGPGNIGRSATLAIDYGTGFVLRQTKKIANNSVTFADFQQDGSNVPSSGVKLVAFTIGDLP